MTKQNIINANSTTPLTAEQGGTGVSSPTSNGVMIAKGSSPVASQTMTDGQVLIGKTGDSPTATTLTAGDNVTITEGAGSITIAAADGLPTMTDGQLIIGSTGNSPVTSTLTAGTNINITNAAGAITIASTAAAGSGINTIKKQVFTSSGTYTPSTGLVYAYVECVGGGGGGGGSGGGDGVASGCSGGGGGYAAALCDVSSVGLSKDIIIGEAGNGGLPGNNSGSAGGSTSFGSLVAATGGNGGAGFPTTTYYNACGETLGGRGTVGAILRSGGNSRLSFSSGGFVRSAGGGDSICGGGAISQLLIRNSTSYINGNSPPASSNGAGGGGGLSGSTSAAGGTGAPGIVIITEYCVV